MPIALLDTIEKTNPWFRSSKVPTRQLQPFKRREFNRLLNDLSDTDSATLIIGCRRVGKSVLMYQMIENLLQKGINPLHILFIQGDNPILKEIHDEKKILTDILDHYQNYVLRKQFQDLEETIYIFIDEAQSLINWDEYLKALIDLKYNIKFVVTGSSSFSLRKGAQNPLTGRVNVYLIPPFSFYDFANFKLKSPKKERLSSDALPLAHEFQDSLINKADIQELFEIAKRGKILFEELGLKRIFEEYLLIGGFPKVVAGAEDSDMSKYLRDLLTTTIAQDISANIRDTQAFERLMVILSLCIGSPISYTAIAEKLGIDERSAAKYIDYYIETHWAYLSSQFLFHKKADSVKTDKKIYIIDSGVVNTLTFKDESDLQSDKEYRGHLVENIIHNHLLFLKQQSGTFQNFIPFWLEPDTKKEIDFIFEIKKGIVPIEVKTVDQISESKLLTIKSLLDDKKTAKLGIVTTENILKVENSILYIPYYIFLLLI